MKALLGIALISSAHAISVSLEVDGSVPDRPALIEAIAQAPDPDTAADQVLIHYNHRGFPAIGVEVEDRQGTRHVNVDVARYGQIALTQGPPRTKKVATNHFRALSGQEVNQTRLSELLADFHANPLHRVVPQLQPAPDGSSVNALLKIAQSQAQQFSLGFQDNGANPLPRERFWVRGEFSDLFGASSLTSALLTSALDPSDFHSLQFGTQLFRQGGQQIGFNLAYSGASGFSVGDFDAYTWQLGTTWQREEKKWHGWERSSSVGLSYRKSNNALEFGAATAAGLADVIQLSLGQELERKDEDSFTRFSARLIASPGGLSSNGDDAAHSSLRPGARSKYLLARAALWHRRDLPKGWDLVGHLSGQWASDPILQADQIALGGAAALRGLPEQFGLGDDGYLGGLELRTPVITLSSDWKMRPSLFLQAGETFDLVLDTSTNAISSGLGLQLAKGDSLRASIHAGWRLDEGGSELHSQLSWTF
jgi:hemolysin activation/secretion protein